MTSRLTDDPLEGGDAADRIQAALRGEAPPRKEIEARGATVLQRALPLLPAGVPIGALVLVRDITEVRRRDRELITKDATIREIHHRVKNNLQTVAALLRLQARRVASAGRPGRAGGVGPPGRLDRARARDAVDVGRRGGRVRRHRRPGRGGRGRGRRARSPRCTLRRASSFGVLPAEIATPLAMVLNELLLNAVEHGFAARRQPDGEVVISAHRFRRQLHVTVADNGRGLPDDFDLDAADRLGLQIVRTLARGRAARLDRDAGPGRRRHRGRAGGAARSATMSDDGLSLSGGAGLTDDAPFPQRSPSAVSAEEPD